MEKANIMKKNLIQLGIVTFCALVLTLTSAQAAPAAQANKVPAPDTYLWNAELVAFDRATRVITVKAPVVGEEAPKEIAPLKTGERIVLTWSGVDRYASGISHAVAYSGAKKSEERFSLPAEFVSYDSTQRYLTFKTKIPADGVARIEALKPGEWVTATSLHGKATDAEPIAAIRPYVIGPNENSNSN
jgi:hypothetical protein